MCLNKIEKEEEPVVPMETNPPISHVKFNISGSFEANRNELERQGSINSGESGSFVTSEYEQNNQSNALFLNIYL